MLTVKQLSTMRRLCGISGKDIANEMETTKQTISNIENEKNNNRMSRKFYILIVSRMIKEIEKGELKNELSYILECLEHDDI